MVVPDLMIDKIDSHWIVLVILGDDVVLYRHGDIWSSGGRALGVIDGVVVMIEVFLQAWY